MVGRGCCCSLKSLSFAVGCWPSPGWVGLQMLSFGKKAWSWRKFGLRAFASALLGKFRTNVEVDPAMGGSFGRSVGPGVFVFWRGFPHDDAIEDRGVGGFC